MREISSTACIRQDAAVEERKSLPIGGSEDRLILYAYEDEPPSSDNIVRMRPDGSIVWKAQAPEAQDGWVDVSLEGDAVIARSRSCWRVMLSATTGAEPHRVFTK